MSGYKAPIQDMAFVMNELGILNTLTEVPGCEDVSAELVASILEAAGKFASNELAPLNQSGDRQGCSLDDGVVRTPDGFPAAYRAFADDGWSGLAGDKAYGGQGLPALISIAVKEIWASANMSWSLCPSLSQGAIKLLSTHGTVEQMNTFLPNLISGRWTGTMEMTEPQAGSDLAQLSCLATRDGDHYRIRGQKIFISWGEHDMADNIVHLVLARTPDAPLGVKGISLFVVPKLLVDANGDSGAPNDLHCISIEHKLGMHASPTCVMSYGDGDGALGSLVGEENRGLEYMFTMMNLERLGVGLQGLAMAERAYQRARDYALERVQGRARAADGRDPVAIINHPDVRRMLLTIRSQIDAMRAVIYDTAALLDVAKSHTDEATRISAQARVNLMTPVVKGWCTDLGTELTSMALQIHGGVGYIEETGAAQYLRDARVAPIYEGTNGVQAVDLVGRKVLRDSGEAVQSFIHDARARARELGDDVDGALIRRHLEDAAEALERATEWLVQSAADDPLGVYAGATYYLRLLGQVAGGAMMAKTATAAQVTIQERRENTGFYRAKQVMARFYAEHVLSQSPALLTPITEGHATIMELSNDEF
jgi:3-(methylthio)propanoyl-CoA dehydrogenase